MAQTHQPQIVDRVVVVAAGQAALAAMEAPVS
jgi:hypothetical protein